MKDTTALVIIIVAAMFFFIGMPIVALMILGG